MLTLRHKNGIYLYDSENLKVLLKLRWIFVVLLSLFFTTNVRLGIYAHQSKCWRGTLSEKGWNKKL